MIGASMPEAALHFYYHVHRLEYNIGTEAHFRYWSGMYAVSKTQRVKRTA
jgi:hypothetical protein